MGNDQFRKMGFIIYQFRADQFVNQFGVRETVLMFDREIR